MVRGICTRDMEEAPAGCREHSDGSQHPDHPFFRLEEARLLLVSIVTSFGAGDTGRKNRFLVKGTPRESCCAWTWPTIRC